MAEQIEKGMPSPQQIAVINNLKALIDELLAMEGNQEQYQEPNMENMPEEEKMAKKEYMEDKKEPMDNKKEDMEKKEKALEQTPSDGVTANDNADESIVGDIPEPSKDNLDAVAKAILQMFNQKTEVQKSTNEDKIATALTELTKAVKSINERQETTEKCLENVLEGLGVADEIKKINKNVEEPKAIRDDSEMKKIITYIAKELKNNKQEQNEQEDSYNGSNHVKAIKSIASILPKICKGE